MRGIVLRRFDSQQVFPEEILPSSIPVATTIPMSATRDEHELEILVFPDQGVHQPVGRFGRNVPVKFAPDQHELALQAVGIVDV